MKVGDEILLKIEGKEKPWQVVGELNQGFGAALYGVSLGRIYNSARAVGYGRWAVELALTYAGTREAFGSTIADYQGVTFPLAQSATELHAAHLMGINAAMLLDHFGLRGLEQRPATVMRIAGGALLITGAILMARG